MGNDRSAFLHQVTAALWPAPYACTLERGRAGDGAIAEFLVLPSAARPRLLVPADRRQGVSVVRHYGEGRRRSSRVVAGLLAGGLRLGLGRLVFRDRLVVRAPGGAAAPSLVDLLGRAAGEEVTVGLHLGAPRANRKPVLQIVGRDGRTLGYAKLGVDPLTDSLVRNEAEALHCLAAARPHGLQVAEVLHTGTWHGHELLVQAALPVWTKRGRLDDDRLAPAIAEVAAIGREDDVQAAASRFCKELDERVAELPAGPAAESLRRLLDDLAPVLEGSRLAFGAAHGDWTPWNMACLGDRLLVWDWERFRIGVPVGFDLLHHGLNVDLVTRRIEPAEAAQRMLRAAPERLAALGIPPSEAGLTAVLYGIDLAARYVADRQLEAGARLGDVGAWLVPALDTAVSRLGETTHA
jgi:hypothetical protein